MSSSRDYFTDSSSYAYNATNRSTSTSSARPHHQLPGQYQTSSSSARHYAPGQYWNTTSSSSAHVRAPEGHRDMYTTSSISHQSPVISFRGAPNSTSTARQTQTNHYRDYTSSSSTPRYQTDRGALSTSSTRQAHSQPTISNYLHDPLPDPAWAYQDPRLQPRPISPVSTVSSNSTERGKLSLSDARNQVVVLRQRLRSAQTVPEIDQIYDDAYRLRQRLKKINKEAEMSVYSGQTPVDMLKEEIDDIIAQL